MLFNSNRVYTGIADDDRRIGRDLMAIGAFDQGEENRPSWLAKQFEAVNQFVTWMRWKGEVSVYGCRVGVDRATRRLESSAG